MLPSFLSRGAFEPALYVQEYPPTVGMLAHSVHQQFMVQVIEEASNVEIDAELIVETSLRRRFQCLMRRLPGL